MISVMKCTCKSAYQDEKYGKDYRLHNKKKDGKWRCAVCGNMKSK